MPFALIVEAALLVVGLCLFISGIKVGRSKSSTLVLLSPVVMTLTEAGMTIAPLRRRERLWFGTPRRQG
jgi:hypothetical protein